MSEHAAMAAAHAKAREDRRQHLIAAYESLRGDDNFSDFQSRRIFATEVLINDPDLSPRTAEFLGKCMVDRNSFSLKQRAWLEKLVEAYLTAPAPEINLEQDASA